TRAETRDRGLPAEVLELILQDRLDPVLGDLHRDLLRARAEVLDLDGVLEILLFGGGVTAGLFLVSHKSSRSFGPKPLGPRSAGVPDWEPRIVEGGGVFANAP